jgi:hypothetical protein
MRQSSIPDVHWQNCRFPNEEGLCVQDTKQTFGTLWLACGVLFFIFSVHAQLMEGGPFGTCALA